MGGSEDGKSAKSEKSSPPPPATATEQNNVHVYPDWAAMQAYYGSRMAMPPYYNPAVASGHPPPPYMWGPQPIMPPFGAPYAVYAPGGVYAHPAVTLATQAPGQGVTSLVVSEPLATTPLSIDTPVKSPGNEKGLMKKLKGFDGLVMSIGSGNRNLEKDEGSADNMLSHSNGTDGSSDGSDGNTGEADHKYNKRKRSREGSPTTAAEDEPSDSKASLLATDKVLGHPITPAISAAGQAIGPPNVATALELLNPSIDMKGNPAGISPTGTLVPSEAWGQNERELKRERRKQSNRESARRSRLRKQAEAEELGRRVESLNAENIALKSEINQLVENSKSLRHENAALLEKLKKLQSEGEENIHDIKTNPTDNTENLLSRVNNSGSANRNSEEETDVYENSSKGGSKFHQLLSAKPRANAVAAG